ncbi:MAG: flagellar biosynthesis protein FlgC [Desulfobulbaceae bacterium]|nr:flagellar biosynthesis protein FlgC [Desulfobulbaceae bacterium]
MIQGSSAALSALSAYGLVLQVGANNIANASSQGYKRDRVILHSAQPTGVDAHVIKDVSHGYFAPEQGGNGLHLTEMSNVDYGRELVDVITAVRSYEANLQTIDSEDELMQSVLDIKK